MDFMNLINPFLKGVKTPFHNLKHFLINIILFSIPVLRLVAIGYVLTCAEETIKNKSKDWQTRYRPIHFLVKSLKVFLLGLPFSAPMIVFLFLALWKKSVFLYFLLALASIFALLFLPGAVFLYLDTGRISAGFRLKDVAKLVFREKFLVNLIIASAYVGILSFIVYSADQIWNHWTYYFFKGTVQYVATSAFFSTLSLAYKK